MKQATTQTAPLRSSLYSSLHSSCARVRSRLAPPVALWAYMTRSVIMSLTRDATGLRSNQLHFAPRAQLIMLCSTLQARTPLTPRSPGGSWLPSVANCSALRALLLC